MLRVPGISIYNIAVDVWNVHDIQLHCILHTDTDVLMCCQCTSTAMLLCCSPVG